MPLFLLKTFSKQRKAFLESKCFLTHSGSPNLTLSELQDFTANETRPRDKAGPVSGKNRRFSVEFHSKSPFGPACPWDGWGFVPGTIVPQGPSDKCFCVLCLLVVFAPNRRAPIGGRLGILALRAVCAISMSRAKNSLPIVPRQFLSLSYPL